MALKQQATQDASSEDIVIRVEGTTKQFGHIYAVKDVTFEVSRGKIFGFIGPSGCGKTTMVRLMAGIYEPTVGNVRVLDQTPIHFTAQTREKIGYMPQLFALYPDLSIWENMNFAASLYGMGLSRDKRFYELLDFVELSEHRHKLARKISGGMKRRLSLAATLVHNPELIFLDEPTAGIDPVLRRKFWDHFKALHKQERTLFVTTQYVGEAAYCDYVGLMVDGELIMVETPEGLRRKAFGGEVIDMFLLESVTEEKHLGPLRDLDIVTTTILGDDPVARTTDKSIRIIVHEASTELPLLIKWAENNDVNMERIEEYLPPFDDVFVKIVERERNNG